MAVGFLGTLLNQTLKLLFRVPRPWVRDPNFTVVGNAKEAAGGYSFPSGHSQTAVGTFGALALTGKQKILRAIFLMIAVLVPFSRMYLGVHTPADVLVGSGCAVALIFLFRFVDQGKYVPQVLIGLTAFSVIFLLFVEWFPFPEDMDAHNLASGIKNAYTLLGCILAMLIAYFVDKKWVNFPVKAVWWAQILKVAIGLALVLAVKEGLRTPLDLFLGASWGRLARYFLIVIMAGVIWPISFRWFAKLGKKD